jgi:putative transposase-like DNA-binding protein
MPHSLLQFLMKNLIMRLPSSDSVLLGCFIVSLEIQSCTRTLHLKVKAQGYAWLDAAAIEVNQVWNYSNESSQRAARPFAGAGKWLSAFDLDKLTAGAAPYFEHIGSETIQRVNAAYATARTEARKPKLRWRVSKGSQRSLGDVSSLNLVKTPMAKSVLDAGWGMLKAQLQYKGQQAGRRVQIVKERNTTRTCYDCKAPTGPTGLDMLDVRAWTCTECSVTHDRDVTAARNVRFVGSSLPSVSRNEPSLSLAPPSQRSSRCEAGISALEAAA